MRPAPCRPPSAGIYRRRRLLAGTLAVASLSLAGWATCSVLAGPGGEPASASGASPAPAMTAIARPGDTLWSIAERAYQRDASPVAMPFAHYVDLLVQRNGGTELAPGDVVLLP